MKLKEIKAAKKFLFGKIVQTPLIDLSGNKVATLFTDKTNAKMKLEFLQHVGSFKSRGVLLGLMKLNDKDRRGGVIAFSAGNHALAVSWASKLIGLSAKVIMPRKADKFRVDGCRGFGAEILLVDDADRSRPTPRRPAPAPPPPPPPRPHR